MQAYRHLLGSCQYLGQAAAAVRPQAMKRAATASRVTGDEEEEGDDE